MSRAQKESPAKIDLTEIRRRKKSQQKLAMITCYDSAFAKLINGTGVDLVLVGDSAGNVVLGYEHTLAVTLDDMIFLTRSVARKLQGPFLVSDLPFMTYKVSREQAMLSSMRLIQEGQASAVKMEGGAEIVPMLEAVVAAGIPVMAHLGLTPQSFHQLGGYKVQGRGNMAKAKLIDDAKRLEQAGAFALVLEMVPAPLAEEVSSILSIPTIGIGAGPHCDGQVLVLHDMLGFEPDFKPRFLKNYCDAHTIIKSALHEYVSEVKGGVFPTLENSFQE